MRVAYLGNFGPSWSTENHLAISLEALGHEVVRVQEGEVRAVDVANRVRLAAADLFLWTQTYGLAEQGGTRDERRAMVEGVRDLGVPSAAVHLDRYFGLAREDQIGVEPWWSCDFVFSADGGNDERFRELEINHAWFQPGIVHTEAVPGQPRARYARPVVFVGSYSYHPEWAYRPQLIDWLTATYHRSFMRWPRRAQIRGRELSDLYASATVVVGDSCLAGNAGRYWSDRIPETLGRAGFLVHPWVEGIDDHYTDGEHLRLYQVGNFDELRRLIDHYVAHPREAREIAMAGHRHVLENHTYRHRMAGVVATVLGDRYEVPA